MRPSPASVWIAAAAFALAAGVAAPATGLEYIGAEAAAEVALSAEVAPPVEATPDDDAYHYAAWRDGRYDALYTEWWYFNFLDERAGVAGIFSYFVTNPEDIGGHAMVQMVAVAYTREATVTAIDRHPAAAFAASGDEADVRIGGNRAWVAEGGGEGGGAGGDGAYRVTGASLDGRLAWDLTYAADSEPWFAFDRMRVGRLAWETMSWLVQMPRARVTGTVTIDGRAHAIRGTGYHDHNWGEWIPTDATWNWAQFSSPRLSLEVGDFIGKPAGVVALDLDGTRTVFTPDQYSLVHTRWGWDRVNRLFYLVHRRGLGRRHQSGERE